MSSVDEQATASGDDAEPRDDEREAQLDAFRRELGDAVVGHHIVPGAELCVRVATDAWLATAEAARRRLGYAYFSFLSALDWLPSPFGRYEDAEVDTPLADRLAHPGETETGRAGGDTRFQVFARVVDVRRRAAVTFKVDVPDDDLAVDTWSSVYAGADWHERETWEMFGIVFRGHPNLTHIYLPSEFEGYPLRKDFPLLARVVKPWPGIVDVEPMPASDDDEEAEPDPADSVDTST
ncbi:MAG: NADH-quinone oxidoreductase subunit C [Acidimicrobiales bacterium]